MRGQLTSRISATASGNLLGTPSIFATPLVRAVPCASNGIPGRRIGDGAGDDRVREVTVPVRLPAARPAGSERCRTYLRPGLPQRLRCPQQYLQCVKQSRFRSGKELRKARVFRSSPGCPAAKAEFLSAERTVVLAPVICPAHRALRRTRHGGGSRSGTRRPAALDGIKPAVFIVFISWLLYSFRHCPCGKPSSNGALAPVALAAPGGLTSLRMGHLLLPGNLRYYPRYEGPPPR